MKVIIEARKDIQENVLKPLQAINEKKVGFWDKLKIWKRPASLSKKSSEILSQFTRNSVSSEQITGQDQLVRGPVIFTDLKTGSNEFSAKIAPTPSPTPITNTVESSKEKENGRGIDNR